MSEHEEFYTPEQVDEQIDAFLQGYGRSARDQRLTSDLRSMVAHPDDASSLQRVLQKLRQDRPERQEQGHIIPFADHHVNHQERYVPLDTPIKRSTPMRLAMRVFSTLAAVVVVVFLLGSFIVVLNNASHQKPVSTTTTVPHITAQEQAPPTGQVIFRSQPFLGIGPAAWSPDGKRAALVVGTANLNTSEVESVDALTGQHALMYTSVTNANIFIAWSPDGSQLAVTEGTQVAVFDAKTAKQLHMFSKPSVALNSGRTPSLGTTVGMTLLSTAETLSGGTGTGFRGVTWSPDGKSLAAIYNGPQNAVFVWDTTTTDAVPKALTGFGSLDTSSHLDFVSWSPGGNQLGLLMATDGNTFEAQIVDTTTWQVTKHYPNSTGLSWAPDGKQLALIDGDFDHPGTEVRIVDAQSGQTLKRFAEVQNAFIYGIYWSPDGTRIAIDVEVTTLQWHATATPISVELWSVANGKLLFPFAQDPIIPSFSSWSPDSKSMLTVVQDHHTINYQNAYVIWKT